VNFRGSDTMVALPHIDKYYGEYCAGGSIPASQHSTVGAWGREREFDMFAHMLDIYDEGMFACVSDTYNIWDAVRLGWGQKLRDRVLNRNGTVVVRPDSGVPEKVVLQVLEELGKCFPVTTNARGYKVLDPHVRVIQGDGVNRSSIERILEVLKTHGWSADNIAFGMGGALLQGVRRDDQRMKIACSHALVQGTGIDVYKDPVTDHGKRSIPGRIKLVDSNGTLVTVPENDPRPSVMHCVFENGEMRNEVSFHEIRARAELAELSPVSL
jgi:nicotinamide phosphoribosyltransferase